MAVDHENKDAIFRLLRFNSRMGTKSDMVSLDSYIEGMKEGQEKIYFVVNPSYEMAMNSPFMEPFKGSDLDVMVLTNNVDEIIFQQNGNYKNKRFVNIESAYEEISKDLGKDLEKEIAGSNRIPEEDITGFCLWMKNELKDSVAKVTISKRLKDTPAIITGQVSSSMRVMYEMMKQSGQDMMAQQQYEQAAKDQTLELNAGHPLIVNLNQLRKGGHGKTATLITRQLLDNVLQQSGIPFDMTKGTARQYQLMQEYIELLVDEQPNET